MIRVDKICIFDTATNKKTKEVKVGDFIYEIHKDIPDPIGQIYDINKTTAHVRKFDKTIISIPVIQLIYFNNKIQKFKK